MKFFEVIKRVYQLLRWILFNFLDAIEWIVNKIFSNSGGNLRWSVLTILLALLWGFSSLSHREMSFKFPSPEIITKQIQYTTCIISTRLEISSTDSKVFDNCSELLQSKGFTFEPLIFEIPFQLLFAPNIFRHIIVLAYAFWLAHKVAAKYQSGLYELSSQLGSEHFLLQASLINPYNRLHIREGMVDKFEQYLPIFLIGGPGLVNIDPKYVALFEQIDGSAQILNHSDISKKIYSPIDLFVRLRAIINLQDQIEIFDLIAITNDGVRVVLLDVVVNFSVQGNGQYQNSPTSYKDFSSSIKSLIFTSGRGPWYLRIIQQIRIKIQTYIGSKLHVDNKAFFKKNKSNEGHFSERFDYQVNDNNNIIGKESNTGSLNLTELEKYVQQDLLDLGIRIKSILVGNYLEYSEYDVSKSKSLFQWVNNDVIVIGQPYDIQSSYDDLRTREMMRLIKYLPIGVFRALKNEYDDFKDISGGLFTAYFEKLKEAYRIYERKLSEIELLIEEINNGYEMDRLIEQRYKLIGDKEKLGRVLAFITRFTSAWLGEW